MYLICMCVKDEREDARREDGGSGREPPPSLEGGLRKKFRGSKNISEEGGRERRRGIKSKSGTRVRAREKGREGGRD